MTTKTLDWRTKPDETAKIEPLLLTTVQAAKMLTIGERTLRRMTQAGTIAVVKIGGSIRYAVEDLHRFIASKRSSISVE